jgi:methionyl-tRNA synthetase
MKQASSDGQWARNALQMTQAWIRDGLQERAITRDLVWGIPVPREGFVKKVFYVWFDAPIGYISITKCLADRTGMDWKSWWQNPDDVDLFQFIGKDNIPFHTVIFPSSLIGSGRNWTKLHHMSSTEYLNYEAGKFSKSKGIGVFGSDAKESGIPAGIWRFYIFYNRPEKSDSLFTWKDFQEKMNSELIGNLGNLVNRTLTFVARYYDGSIPSVNGLVSAREDIKSVSSALVSATGATLRRITELFEWAELRDAFHEIFLLSSIANKAFQDGEPWKTRTTDPEKAGALLHDLCYLIKDLMIMTHPFMPGYADRVADFFGKKIWSGTVFDEALVDAGMAPDPLARARDPETLCWSDLGKREGLSVVKMPEIIFRPMDDATSAAYRERYAGSQKERKEKESKMEQDTEKKSSKSPVQSGAVPVSTEKAVAQHASSAVPKPAVLPADEIFNLKVALKTAKIIKIERHPDAEKLYIETLDDGSGTERIIVSGLVPYFREEELLGKSIIIADNLKPRKMRGVESRGMLLAGDFTDSDGVEHIEVLDSSWAVPGTPVVLEGSVAQEKPASIDADTFFAAPMHIVDHSVQINGKRLLIDGKPVTAKNIVTGEVS